MTWLDRYLQRWRITKAMKYIAQGNTVLDIGTHKGELLLMAKSRIRLGIGIDPLCENLTISPYLSLRKGMFPATLTEGQTFDRITALAVLEHVPTHTQPAFMAACYQHLNKGGLLIISVPNARVDKILAILTRLKLVKGMSLEEHFGFDESSTPELGLQAGLQLFEHKKFQLGLNNLYVFKKQ